MRDTAEASNASGATSGASPNDLRFPGSSGRATAGTFHSRRVQLDRRMPWYYRSLVRQHARYLTPRQPGLRDLVARELSERAAAGATGFEIVQLRLDDLQCASELRGRRRGVETCAIADIVDGRSHPLLSG